MIRRLALLIPLAAALAGPAPDAGAAVRPGTLLLVVNQGADQLQIFDGTSYRILEVVKVGRRPHQVAVSPDGRRAYVSDFGDSRNTISVIDLEVMARERTIDPKPQYGPHGLVVSRDGTRLFCTTERSRTVSVIDLKTDSVTDAFFTDELLTHQLAVTPDERYILATNGKGNNVSVIDLRKRELVKSIYTGKGAEGIDITPDGRQAWVCNPRGQTVAIIDLASMRRTATFDVPGYPISLVVSPDGRRVWVANESRGLVQVFDVASHELVGQVRTGGTPVYVTTDAGGTRVFASNLKEANVVVIDAKKLETVERITTGKGPEGLAWVDRRR